MCRRPQHDPPSTATPVRADAAGPRESDPARQGHRVYRVGCRGRRGRTVPLRLGVGYRRSHSLTEDVFVECTSSTSPPRSRSRAGSSASSPTRTTGSNRGSSWREIDPVPYPRQGQRGEEPARDRRGRPRPARGRPRPVAQGGADPGRDRQAGRGPPHQADHTRSEWALRN